jgi:hypothetical protein
MQATHQAERERHALLTHLTSVLLGLQLLQRRTDLSAQQGLVLAEALRSAQEMGLILVTQIVEAGDDDDERHAAKKKVRERARSAAGPSVPGIHRGARACPVRRSAQA